MKLCWVGEKLENEKGKRNWSAPPKAGAQRLLKVLMDFIGMLEKIWYGIETLFLGFRWAE